MSTLNKALLGVIVLLILTGIGLLVNKNLNASSYYAVFMSTGDMYFGQLHRFPKLGLASVYALQKNTDNRETPFSLVKFGDAFWGPQDYMQLSKENVLWISKLKADSQVVKFIESKKK